jgi:hypothetical protein
MSWHGAQGIFTLADGRRFEWRQKTWFNQSGVFVDGKGCEVVSVRMGRECGTARLSDVLKTQATVATSPGLYEARTLGLLVFTSWFLVVLQSEEAAAAASITPVS